MQRLQKDNCLLSPPTIKKHIADIDNNVVAVVVAFTVVNCHFNSNILINSFFFLIAVGCRHFED